MDPIDSMTQTFTDHSDHAFVRAAGASFTGAILGAMLDDTRFGRWFNTSKFIGYIFDVIKLSIIGLVGLYVYFVIKVW